MITTRLWRRSAAVSLAAVLATTAATTERAAPARPATTKVAPACPQSGDRLKAAANREVDIDRITPKPVWRTTCGTLYRSDSRGPAVVFEQGFHPRDVVNGQYDVERYVLVNQPSPYVPWR